MSDSRSQMDAARIVAEAARARLTETAGTVRERIAPNALARDAARGVGRRGRAVAHEGIEAARRHPGTLAGLGAIIAALALRRPLARLFKRR